MKKKDTVLILGIFSILILISVQIFMVRGIWKQKDEMFVLRYTLRSQEALNFINRRMPGDGFDTVRYILGSYSEQANKEIHAIKDPKELEAKKNEILDFFTRFSIRNRIFPIFYLHILKEGDLRKNSIITIVINSLEMISNDTIRVYHSQEFDNRLTQERVRKTTFN